MRKLIVAATVAATALAAGGPTPLAGALGRTSPSIGLAGPAMDPLLARQLRAGRAGAGDIVTAYVHAPEVDTARRAALGAGLRVLDRYDRVGVVVAAGPAGQLASLRDARGLTYLEAVRPFDLDLDGSLQAVRADEAADLLPAPGGGAFDGGGVGVGIIDSGVDASHPMLRGRVVRNVRMLCQPDAMDCTTEENKARWIDAPGGDSDVFRGGHGTHVAGIAAGAPVTASDGRALRGVAPGASIVGIAVSWPDTDPLGVLELPPEADEVPVDKPKTHLGWSMASGLNWALEHHGAPCGTGVSAAACPPLRVVNLSLSAPAGDYDPNSVIAKLQDALVADGVVVVWSAGNFGENGADRATTSQVHSWKQSPTPGVITAASYFDGDAGTREGSVSTYSSRGRIGDVATYPDLSAPGENVYSACRPTLVDCYLGGLDQTPDPNYNSFSGTSMAAPHVAGAAALLLQANPSLTPAQVENILEDTAYKYEFGAAYEPDLLARNDGTTSEDKGHGLLDVAAALAGAMGVPAPAEVDPCDASAPIIVDRAGDAVKVVAWTPLPSAPSVDILRSTATWNAAAQAVDFTLTVSDLPDPAVSSDGLGEYFDFEFKHAGRSIGVVVNRAVDLPAGVFHLADYADGRTIVARNLVGRVDIPNATFHFRVANADLARATAPIPPFESGDMVNGFFTTARRDLGVAVPDADTAGGRCWMRIP